MPGIIDIIRCVGRAVVKNRGKALASLVPFGEVVYEVAKDAYEDYRKDHSEAELRGDLARLAQAVQTDARQVAEEVASDVAAGQSAEVRQAITTYLTQMPATVRQSLRRPSDPSGTTVPAGLSFKRPEDLLPFLPTGLPRFKPADRPLAADWELVEMLGKGGFGEVWKARHIHHSQKKPVALKFFVDPVAADTLRNDAGLQDHLDRVREEVSLPGIVPLLETYLRADPPCLMYELIEGGDLTGLIQEMRDRGELTPEFATRVIHRLASILATAHKHGLVHRNLKPSNILVQRGEANNLPPLFVADYGIGTLATGRAIQEHASSCMAHLRPILTVIRGASTPLYASPQQVAGERPDPRDDVYALGVIWYQLLTSNLKLLAIPPDWREEVEEKGLGAELVRLLASCLSSRSEKRPFNAEELSIRLDGLLKAVPSDRDSGRKELPAENDPDRKADAGVQLQAARGIKVRVDGEWFARPATDSSAKWTLVRRTPGPVSLSPGKVYMLEVAEWATEADLSDLAQVPDLTAFHSLDLKNFKKVTDAGLSHLQGLTGLQSLNLEGCKLVTDKGLAHLVGLTGLQSLNLEGCKLVTDKGLAHLVGLTGLQSLNLSSCYLTDEMLVHLVGLTGLQSLNLSSCYGSEDEGLVHLRKLMGLQSLNLGYCNFVTDDSLVHLGGLNGLRSLNLEFCDKVTDEGLAHLRRLTGLQSLNLEGCDLVTDAGLSSLQQAIPGCQIS